MMTVKVKVSKVVHPTNGGMPYQDIVREWQFTWESSDYSLDRLHDIGTGIMQCYSDCFVNISVDTLPEMSWIAYPPYDLCVERGYVRMGHVTPTHFGEVLAPEV